MSVIAADLIEYGSASRPEDETSTSGGAIDDAARPLDTQIAGATEDLEFVSDEADTRTMTIVYRDAGGTIQTFGPTALDGTTPVAGPTGVQRILKATLSATDATATVTLRIASAGATRHTFNPLETDAFIMFQRSSSSGSTEDFWEKTFWKNTNADTDLTSAEVTLTADPSSKFEIALDTAIDATVSVTNRKTDPSLTEQDDSTAIGVPTGTLGFGEAIGLWRHMTLGASAAADEPSSTTQLAGQTT
jgi:hypothetical protein